MWYVYFKEFVVLFLFWRCFDFYPKQMQFLPWIPGKRWTFLKCSSWNPRFCWWKALWSRDCKGSQEITQKFSTVVTHIPSIITRSPQLISITNTPSPSLCFSMVSFTNNSHKLIPSNVCDPPTPWGMAILPRRRRRSLHRACQKRWTGGAVDGSKIRDSVKDDLLQSVLLLLSDFSRFFQWLLDICISFMKEKRSSYLMIFWDTLPKFNIEPTIHDGFQKESPIPGCDFQVLC